MNRLVRSLTCLSMIGLLATACAPPKVKGDGLSVAHPGRPLRRTSRVLGITAAVHCAPDAKTAATGLVCNAAIVAPNVAVTAAHCALACSGRAIDDEQFESIAGGFRLIPPGRGENGALRVEKVQAFDRERDWVVLKLEDEAKGYRVLRGEQPLSPLSAEHAPDERPAEVRQIRRGVSKRSVLIRGSARDCGTMPAVPERSKTILSFRNGSSGAPMFIRDRKRGITFLGIHVGRIESGQSDGAKTQQCKKGASRAYGKMVQAHAFWEHVKAAAAGGKVARR